MKNVKLPLISLVMAFVCALSHGQEAFNLEIFQKYLSTYAQSVTVVLHVEANRELYPDADDALEESYVDLLKEIKEDIYLIAAMNGDLEREAVDVMFSEEMHTFNEGILCDVAVGRGAEAKEMMICMLALYPRALENVANFYKKYHRMAEAYRKSAEG